MQLMAEIDALGGQTPLSSATSRKSYPEIASIQEEREIMRQLLTLMVLLLGAAWAAAQAYPSQTNPSTSSNPSSSQTSSMGSQSSTGDTGSQKTVVGCLSSSNGNYTLTGNDGKSYQLTGDTAQLSDHVGHQIQVKGNVLSASASSPGSSSGTSSAASGSSSSGSSSSGQSTLSVSSIKHLSTTCSNKSSSSSY